MRLVTSILILSIFISGYKSGCLVPSDPNLQLIAIARFPGEVVKNVAVKGSTVFLVSISNSPQGVLRSIDVSDPAYPQVVTSSDLIGYTPRNLTQNGNHLYVTSSSENLRTTYLEVFDVSNPHSLQRISTLLEEDAAYLAIGIKENTAYLFKESVTREIVVLDILDPTNPTFIRSITTSQDFPVFNIRIHNNLALLANSGLGLSFLDIETPQVPALLPPFETESGTVYDATAKDGHAYVPRAIAPGEDFGELLVIDINNPTLPELVTSLETGHIPYGVALEGSTLIVGVNDARSNYVLLINISNPSIPQKIARADIPPELDQPLGSVVIKDSLIFVSCVGGLAIYEILRE